MSRIFVPFRFHRVVVRPTIVAFVGLAICTSVKAQDWPRKDEWLFIRASAHFTQRHMPDAIKDLTAAIESKPDDTFYYYFRATAYEANADYQSACADLSQMLELGGDKAFVYVDRGRVKSTMQNYREALADYDMAISKNPILARAYCAKALLLASCPDDAIRDGVEAVQTATRGYELAENKRPYLSALAAAYAEFGDWASAVEMQTKALGLAKEAEDRHRCQERLKLYEAKQPYRETPELIERDRLAFLSRPQQKPIFQFRQEK
jgi:tetratricopeptide (TPR) repeat protein